MLVIGLVVLWTAIAGIAHASVQLPLTAYDQGNGLATLSVVRMTQDRAGFVWAGTEKGLYRFDGIGFVSVGSEQGFQTSEVISFAEDASGHLWVGSRAGVQRRDDTGHFEWVRPRGRVLVLDRGQTLAGDESGGMFALSGHQLLHLSLDAGGEWQMVPVFDAAQIRKMPGLAQISAVFHRGGDTWFGCGEALCRLSGGQLTRHGAEQGVPADRWLGFLGARDGSLWARGIHGIRRLVPGAVRFEARDIPDGHARVAASSLDIVEDRAGRVLTRSDEGMARWDGTQWELFGTGNGLPGVGISALLADRDGMVWMGTFGRGVMYWNSNDAVENWTAAQGLNDSLIWSITRADPNTLWIAGENGGQVIAPGESRARPWPLAITAPHQTHAVVVDARGRIWYFMFDGRVVRYEPDTHRTTVMATLPHLVRGALIDRHGGLWAYTLGGLYGVDANTGEASRIAPDLIPPSMCSDLDEDAAGRLWLACSTGLYRRNEHGWARVSVQPEALGGYENVTTTPDGRLWLSALQPGLLVGKVGDGDSLAVTTVTDPLLADTRFYFLRPDRDGRLWAGGGNGVDVLDNGRWTRLSDRDGLLWNETNHGAFHADDDGSVWIGAPVGLTHILKPARLLAPRRIEPLIVSAQYAGHELSSGAPAQRFENGAALVFRFGVIGNGAGHPVHFRYRLSGVDKDWVEIAQPEVRYASLPSGSYRFELQAIDVHRRAVSEAIVREWHIAPPWWLSPWIALLAAAAVVGGIVLAWRWRMAVLIRHARILEDMVSERTAELQQSLRSRSMLLAHIGHDLRSPLVGILDSLRQWRAGSMERHPPERIERHVRQQMSLIDELLEFSRGELVELQPEPVPGYLYGFLHEVADSAALLAERRHNRLVCRFADDLPPVVSADFRRLRQVLLNLLGNAAKFTADGTLVFRVDALPLRGHIVRLRMTIQDDGIGLGVETAEGLSQPFVRGHNAAGEQGHGLGLSIVVQLLQRMETSLASRAAPGGGTVFSFDLALPLAEEHEVDSLFTGGEPVGAYDGAGCTVIVAEGDPDKRAMLCDLLDGYGYVTLSHPAVHDAAVPGRPDLIILGPGSDGREALSAWRRAWPDVPLVWLICGPAPAETPLWPRDADAILAKPVDANALLSTVSALLTGSVVAKADPTF